MKTTMHGGIKLGLALAVILALAAFGLGTWYATPDPVGAGGNATGGIATETAEEHEAHGLEKTVDQAGNIVWTCSMHPQIQLPEPGKCPICFMDLIPLEKNAQGEAMGLRQVSLTEQGRKLAEIETAPVVRQAIEVQTRMVGKVDYDETRVGVITTWMGGRIDKLHIDYTGSTVRKGQPMASIYSPELLTAQAELIEAIKAKANVAGSNLKIIRDTAERTERAAREKLRLLGFSQAQVDKVVAEGKPADHITLYAPMGGVVIKKDVVEGAYVKTGTPIYTIADLSRVWVVLEAYESDLPWINMGMNVEFTTEAHPGKRFHGKVVYIDPVVNEATRTVRVRLEAANRGLALKPGMFVRAVHRAGDGKQQAEAPLVVPASAPLVTGKRAVVYVAVPDKDGVYEGREIVLGPRAGDKYVVLHGLAEGEQVVTKGNFKIDSAVQIIARPSMMNQGESDAERDQAHAVAAHAEHEPGSEKAAPMPDMPPLFLSKIAFLPAAFNAVHDAAFPQTGAPDLDAARAAYGKLYEAVEAIDATGLKGDPALVWRELAMLLKNDAVLGAEASSPERLARVAGETAQHFERLDAAFAVRDLAKVLGNKIDAPAAFRDDLAKVYEAYADIAKYLSLDKLAKAQEATGRAAEALSKVDAGGLLGEARNIWETARGHMADGLEAMRGAQDIVGVRAGFEPLSEGLTQAVDRLGAAVDAPIYEAFCPMAFDFKGARWLQGGEQIKNPYFGRAMYRCGEVERRIAAQ